MSIKRKISSFAIGPATARYPRLDQPYYYDMTTKRSVPDPTGRIKGSSLSTEVVMTEQDAAPYMSAIRQLAAEAGLDLEEVKNWPFSKEKDAETKKPTGNIIFKMKKYATDKQGNVNRVTFVDSKLKPLPRGFKLTSGSSIRVNGYMAAFAEVGGGVSLRLDSVQVLKYVPYTGSTNGFTIEDDGFDASDFEDTAPETIIASTSPQTDIQLESYDF